MIFLQKGGGEFEVTLLLTTNVFVLSSPPKHCIGKINDVRTVKRRYKAQRVTLFSPFTTSLCALKISTHYTTQLVGLHTHAPLSFPECKYSYH